MACSQSQVLDEKDTSPAGIYDSVITNRDEPILALAGVSVVAGNPVAPVWVISSRVRASLSKAGRNHGSQSIAMAGSSSVIRKLYEPLNHGIKIGLFLCANPIAGDLAVTDALQIHRIDELIDG